MSAPSASAPLPPPHFSFPLSPLATECAYVVQLPRGEGLTQAPRPSVPPCPHASILTEMRRPSQHVPCHPGPWPPTPHVQIHAHNGPRTRDWLKSCIWTPPPPHTHVWSLMLGSKACLPVPLPTHSSTHPHIHTAARGGVGRSFGRSTTSSAGRRGAT